MLFLPMVFSGGGEGRQDGLVMPETRSEIKGTFQQPTFQLIQFMFYFSCLNNAVDKRDLFLNSIWQLHGTPVASSIHSRTALLDTGLWSDRGQFLLDFPSVRA